MTIRKTNSSATHFLNVDLDIYARSDLQPIVNALGRKVIVLHAGRTRGTHHAHLELARTRKTADATIRGFCELIRALPKRERDLWNTAKVRDFNIGVQAGTRPYATEFAVAAETLKAAHESGARLVLTVYAPHPA